MVDDTFVTEGGADDELMDMPRLGRPHAVVWWRCSGGPRAGNFLLDGVTTVVGGNCGGSETDIREWSGGLAGLGINVATLVGHNSIRRTVMGLDARTPTSLELQQMQALVEKAMQDGAVGFSTGLL